jgi:hypothetical protein
MARAAPQLNLEAEAVDLEMLAEMQQVAQTRLVEEVALEVLVKLAALLLEVLEEVDCLLVLPAI